MFELTQGGYMNYAETKTPDVLAMLSKLEKTVAQIQHAQACVFESERAKAMLEKEIEPRLQRIQESLNQILQCVNP